MARIRRLRDPAGTAVALAGIVLGAVLIREAGGMTPLGSVFPITVSVAMIGLGAILVLRNLLVPSAGAPSPDSVSEMPAAAGAVSPRGPLRRAVFLAAMFVWVLLLPVLGFFAASLLGYFAVMAVALHERPSPRMAIGLVAAGVAMLAGFTLLMGRVLLIPLPRGILF